MLTHNGHVMLPQVASHKYHHTPSYKLPLVWRGPI